MQTLIANVLRKRPEVARRRERLTLPDGDFIDLDWGPEYTGAPVVLILHGLEGSSHSRYACALQAALSARQTNSVVMHFRGCSGEPNLKPHGYCAGTTEDLDWLVDRLNHRHRNAPISAVGYSIGGNVLLKWLGERGVDARLSSAVAVSVPYRLADCAKRMNTGFSRLYQYTLVRHLKWSTRRRAGWMSLPVDLTNLDKLKTFRAFDDAVTAPLHGYKGVDDYYNRASAAKWLAEITAPTLLIHAADDPFMLPDTAPDASELSPSITLELSRYGGHVGFYSADKSKRYWLDHRIPQWLEESWRALPARHSIEYRNNSYAGVEI